jgi:hypothetical protein
VGVTLGLLYAKPTDKTAGATVSFPSAMRNGSAARLHGDGPPITLALTFESHCESWQGHSSNCFSVDQLAEPLRTMLPIDHVRT